MLYALCDTAVMTIADERNIDQKKRKCVDFKYSRDTVHKNIKYTRYTTLFFIDLHVHRTTIIATR